LGWHDARLDGRRRQDDRALGIGYNAKHHIRSAIDFRLGKKLHRDDALESLGPERGQIRRAQRRDYNPDGEKQKETFHGLRI
jgi:hypothetical protein